MLTNNTWFKFTGNNAVSIHGGSGSWYLPKGKRPGRWMGKVANPIACTRGYHLLRGPKALLDWGGVELWVAEGRGASHADHDKKFAFEQARLISRVETWNEGTARLWAADCAEQAIQRLSKPDGRSINAIRVARLYALGEVDDNERSAAWSAAWAAAGYAAWSAARSAARSAAWSAAGYAARSDSGPPTAPSRPYSD